MSQTSPNRTGGRDRNVAIATLPGHRSELATLDLDQLLSVELIRVRGQELSGNKITNKLSVLVSVQFRLVTIQS